MAEIRKKAGDRAQDIAVATLERIEKEKLLPTPHNYELWFHYYQGDPEVVRAIDGHKGVFDEAMCQRIYQRILSSAARDETVQKISDQVHQAIAEIALMLGSVKSANSEYGSSLDDASTKIANASSLEDLGDIVSAIVADTKKVVERSQNLEIQLTTSSTQVAELRSNLESVRKEAMTDGLTGLSNRKAFDRYIEHATNEARESGVPMVLLMLDVDHFKKFNDLHGHLIGDQVLRLVARTLTDGVKGKDIAARYGGEEFAIILPETPVHAGIAVANSLRKQVELKEVINRTTNQHLGRITLSAGVAQYIPGESVSDLIERADNALYKAKKSGRNCVESAEQ